MTSIHGMNHILEVLEARMSPDERKKYTERVVLFTEKADEIMGLIDKAADELVSTSNPDLPENHPFRDISKATLLVEIMNRINRGLK